MDRRLLAILSTDPDINDMRQSGVELVEKYSREPYIATQKDLDWFFEDLDIDTNTEFAKEVINKNIKIYDKRYPFLITEWFGEFYTNIDGLHIHMRPKEQIDWNLFFTFAYPLPTPRPIPLWILIKKLNVVQYRGAKEYLKNEVWNNEELRTKILHEDLIPSIYTHYVPYNQLRHAIVERSRKLLQEERKGIKSMISRDPNLHLISQISALKAQGIEIELRDPNGSIVGKI